MYPPATSLSLDIDAISGICGSVSIACWVVVFSPQIIENFRRGSAEGLSVLFIAAWLAGDVFNIAGAVLQGVLPTMVILAVYYTLADVVLLGQCFYYKGFTLTDTIAKPCVDEEPASLTESERTPLLAHNGAGNGHYHHQTPLRASDIDRRHSFSSFAERVLAVDGTHLSPVTPLIPDPKPGEEERAERAASSTSGLKTVLFNLGAIVLVCAAGVFGWWLSGRSKRQGAEDGEEPVEDEPLALNVWGQVFGYICAALYLGSRLPQLLLNYRRKSTEGISMLFFLFACIGNLTYVFSILAYAPSCGQHCTPGQARKEYACYIVVNLSWLTGSFGTLLLDAAVFVQYFMYKNADEDPEDEESGDGLR